MLFNRKFDLIVSIGEDCACTSYLRRFKLQKYSYPFDWLTHATFETRINLVINDFENFLNIDDLKQMPKPEQFSVDEKHDYYENIFNGFYFWHDFPFNTSLQEGFDAVKEKYERRIKRLYKEIDNADNVLFVWFSRNNYQDYQLVEKSYYELKNKFSNQNVFLLILEHSETDERTYLADNHILISKYDNKSYQENPKWNRTMGNEANNEKLFRQIKLKRNLDDYLSDFIYFIQMFAVNFIPKKALRHKLRDKIIFKRNHAKL